MQEEMFEKESKKKEAPVKREVKEKAWYEADFKKPDTASKGKLWVPQDFLDKHPQLEFRWTVADKVNQRLREGWVVVEDSELANLKGSSDKTVRVVGGKRDKGDEFDQVLMAHSKSVMSEARKERSAVQRKSLDAYESGREFAGHGLTGLSNNKIARK